MRSFLARKRTGFYLFILLLGIIVFAACSSFVYQTIIPSDFVIYYDRVISQQRLTAEVGTTFCSFLPIPEPARIIQWFSNQPTARCFDSLYELEVWLTSTGHPGI
jgi:hypothetical protein